MERKQIIEHLVKLDMPLMEIMKQLAEFKWDSEELVTLTVENLTDKLNRILDGSLDAEEVSAWADIVEMRDDIDYETDEVKQAIFEMANPDINGELNQDKVSSLMRSLT